MFCKHNDLKNACLACAKDTIVRFKSAIEKLGGVDFIADQVYDMKSMAIANDDDYTGSSWEHPDVVMYQNGLKELKELMKEGSK